MICGHGHEQKFKYLYPRDSKIIQMPYPRAKAIDQNPPIETCGLLRLCNDSEDARFFRGFTAGAGENTLRRLELFVYLDHPTKNDVTSGKKVS